jgi:hypothetical protein
MRTLLCLVILLGALHVSAQELPDSGLPDAAVGQGGADRMNEEGDTEGSPCLDSRTCAQGLACVSGRCVPSKVKNVGCSAAPLSLAGAVGLLASRRRARR